MNKIYKFYRYARKQGIGGAAYKTGRYIKSRLKVVKKPISIMVDVADIVNADIYRHPYKRPAPIHKDILSIAWVLSPLAAGSGGQTTITRFARFLKQQGHHVTFYIYEGVHPQLASEAKTILEVHFNLEVEVKAIADYEEADVLIATGWETAYPTFNLKTKAHKFYFVQDFEPLFYGKGSKYVLAENTYRMGFYGITAGRWLSHVLESDYAMKSDFFDFGVDLDIYRPNDVADLKKQKKIVFYARPVTERRAFELGIVTLELFHRQHPECTIEFVGWDVSNFDIPFPYVNRGIVTPAELADLYQDSAACLVLSLTNVSLLPLELLAAGCIPVMNDGDNNRMVLGDNEFIRYAPTAPIQLAEQLSAAVSNERLDETARKAADSVRGTEWHDSYQKVEAIIKREIAKR